MEQYRQVGRRDRRGEAADRVALHCAAGLAKEASRGKERACVAFGSAFDTEGAAKAGDRGVFALGIATAMCLHFDTAHDVGERSVVLYAEHRANERVGRARRINNIGAVAKVGTAA